MSDNASINKAALLKSISNRIKRLEADKLTIDAKLSALREIETSIEIDKW